MNEKRGKRVWVLGNVLGRNDLHRFKSFFFSLFVLISDPFSISDVFCTALEFWFFNNSLYFHIVLLPWIRDFRMKDIFDSFKSVLHDRYSNTNIFLSHKQKCQQFELIKNFHRDFS